MEKQRGKLLKEDGKELAKTSFVEYVPQGENIKVRREKR